MVLGGLMSSTVYALTGFIAWALFLLVLMEIIRTYLVVTGRVAANSFKPDNSGLSPFMQRLAALKPTASKAFLFLGLIGGCHHDVKNRHHRPTGLVVSWCADRAVDYPLNFDKLDCGKPALHSLRAADGDLHLLGMEADGVKNCHLARKFAPSDTADLRRIPTELAAVRSRGAGRPIAPRRFRCVRRKSQAALGARARARRKRRAGRDGILG